MREGAPQEQPQFVEMGAKTPIRKTHRNRNFLWAGNGESSWVRTSDLLIKSAEVVAYWYLLSGA
jgi:hypothetical protein